MAKDRRDHEIVHRIIQKHICDAIGILSRLNVLEISIIFFFRLLRELCIVRSGYNSGAHPGRQILEYHGQTDVILDFLVSALFVRELVEVCVSIWPADEVALFQVKFHALNPLADTLEFVIVVTGIAAYSLDKFNGDWVAFWI